MGRLRWYKRYPHDWLEGVRGLSPEETGAYANAVELIYDHDNRLPDDDAFIAGKLGWPLRVWKRLKARLLKLDKLYVEGGQLRNRRADEVTKEAFEILGKRESAGKAPRGNGRKSGGETSGGNDLDEAHEGAERGISKTLERKTQSLTVVVGVPDSRAERADDHDPPAPPVEVGFLHDCEAQGGNPASQARVVASWKAALPYAKFVTILETARGKREPWAYALRAVGNAITELEAAKYAATAPPPEAEDPLLKAIRLNREMDERRDDEPRRDRALLS